MSDTINLELNEILNLDEETKNDKIYVSGEFEATMKEQNISIVVSYTANSDLELKNIEYVEIKSVLNNPDINKRATVVLDDNDLLAVKSIIRTELLFAIN